MEGADAKKCGAGPSTETTISSLHFRRKDREEHSLMVSMNELSQKEVEDRGVGGFTMREKA